MLSPAIVVDFNVIKKSLLCLGYNLKITMMNHLCFFIEWKKDSATALSQQLPFPPIVSS